MHGTSVPATVPFLYKLLKINGMAPFSYSSTRKFIYSSSVSTITSACICTFVMGIAFFCDVQLSKGYTPYQGKAIEYVVGYALFYYNLIKILINVFIQLVHRDELIRVLNQIIATKSKFEQFLECERFEDEKFAKSVRNRQILGCIQVAVLICSIGCYMYRTLYLNYALLSLCYVAAIYINLFSTLSTGIYFNGSMMVINRFYRILIWRLKYLLIIVKRKKCTNGIISSLEVTSMLFTDTLTLLKTVRQFFAVQVILSILGSFIFSLIPLFNSYNSVMRKRKQTESVPISDVLIDIAGASGFALFHMIDFYCIATVSTMVYKMNAKATSTIHGYWSKNIEFRMKNVIEILSCQLLQHSCAINSIKFCVINKQTAIAVLSTVASYLAILVQFELADQTTVP